MQQFIFLWIKATIVFYVLSLASVGITALMMSHQISAFFQAALFVILSSSSWVWWFWASVYGLLFTIIVSIVRWFRRK